jgi:hypothetical protein
MTLLEIKRMLRIRRFYLILSILLSGFAIVFSLGHPWIHWSLGGALVVAAVCVILALVCLLEFFRVKAILAARGL